MQPSARRLTRRPVRPRFVYSMPEAYGAPPTLMLIGPRFGLALPPTDFVSLL
ncbi:hypothetical protein ACFPRL_19620 [Pseudoclavibacter helvolus]